MGKTTLLAAAERLGRRHGFRIVLAAAPEGSVELTHALVEDVVRGLPEALAALDPEERALLAQVALRGAAAPGRVASALMHLLAEACTVRPVMLLLDDLHWADRASLSALVLAVGRLSAEPLVLLGAARPRPALDPRTAQWERMDVEPLQPDAAVGVLRANVARRALHEDPGSPGRARRGSPRPLSPRDRGVHPAALGVAAHRCHVPAGPHPPGRAAAPGLGGGLRRAAGYSP